MKFKDYTGITWSDLELTGLLEDEDSCVHLERVKKHFGLHPYYLTNLNVAFDEILSSNLNFYDAELKGFPLAYKNPTLLTPLGEILHDTCFIHVDVEAHFYIFRPKVGCDLRGIVSKKGHRHIGVLVHKAFNISVHKPEDDTNWPGNHVMIHQEIRLTVSHLNVETRLPSIRGTLDEREYLRGCKLPELSEEVKFVKNGHNNSTEAVQNGDSHSSDFENTQETICLAKKKKKKKHSLSTDITDVEEKKQKKHSGKWEHYNSEAEDTVSHIIDEEEKRKKKCSGKWEHYNSEAEDIINEDTMNICSNTVGIERKHLKKKQSKTSTLSELNDSDIVNIKIENDVDLIEDTVKKNVKLKKHSSRHKYGDVEYDDDTNDDVKRHLNCSSKKSSRNSESEPGLVGDICIKSEKLQEHDNECQKEFTHKKRTKKHSTNFNGNGSDIENQMKKEKKYNVEDVVIKYEDITIKKEKHDHFENSQEEYIYMEDEISQKVHKRKRRKSNSSDSTILVSPKKESPKKSSKKVSEMLPDVLKHTPIKIKSEKVDDNVVEHKYREGSVLSTKSSRKKDTLKTPTKRPIADDHIDLKHENSKNCMKKLKLDSEIEDEVIIKKEKCTFSNEINSKGILNKLARNNKNVVSEETDNEKKTECGRHSHKKHKKKIEQINIDSESDIAIKEEIWFVDDQ